MAATPHPVDPEPLAAAAPHPDCGHQDWSLGCVRCFWEMEQIARSNIREAHLEDQLTGAILFNWHIMTVLQNMEDQAIVAADSLDLHRQQLGKDLAANIKALALHLVTIVADPRKLTICLEKASKVAEATSRAVKEREAKGETAPKPRSSLIITDGI